MLLFLKVQFINSGVMSTPLAKGSAVVNRMAVLAFPILLLNVTVSNLKKRKILGLQTPSCRELELGARCTGGKIGCPALSLRACRRLVVYPLLQQKRRLFSRGVIFTPARVSLALLSLRKNGGLLVVYLQPKASQRREELFSSDLSVLFKYAQIYFQCQKSSSLSQSNPKIPSP